MNRCATCFSTANPSTPGRLQYSERLAAWTRGLRAGLMQKKAVNPKFVLRNHLGEEAIRAAKLKDFSAVDTLLALLQPHLTNIPAMTALPVSRPTGLHRLKSVAVRNMSDLKSTPGPEHERQNPENRRRMESPAGRKRRRAGQAFEVTRHAATERPYTGKYEAVWADGSYHCICCGAKLFESETKFDAGCGWPSFSEEAVPGAIEEIVDRKHGMVRTETVCGSCGAHLGHVFPDGPDTDRPALLHELRLPRFR
jgi:methionine-R-sulfoxide reductase